MPGMTHYSASGSAPAYCGNPQATAFSSTAATVTCTQCKSKLASQTTPQPFGRTN